LNSGRRLLASPVDAVGISIPRSSAPTPPLHNLRQGVWLHTLMRSRGAASVHESRGRSTARIRCGRPWIRCGWSIWYLSCDSTPLQCHCPTTRPQQGISKSMQYTDGTVRWCMVASSTPKEPTHVSQALNGPKWVSAMDSEHQALL
jgi:hypothetical protein